MLGYNVSMLYLQRQVMDLNMNQGLNQAPGMAEQAA